MALINRTQGPENDSALTNERIGGHRFRAAICYLTALSHEIVTRVTKRLSLVDNNVTWKCLPVQTRTGSKNLQAIVLIANNSIISELARLAYTMHLTICPHGRYIVRRLA